MNKKKKTLSTKQFVKQCTNITMKYLSTLPTDERRKRVRAFKRAATSACRDGSPKHRVASELPELRMSAREPE